ncbi:MAG: bifunctional UDP-sugar hydrolase/5'-nucleotidase [Lentimicrobiaceae bacterium]|jgi:2',3'-cyclic-nucleotide 2'-phosphodiesterase (5'-nucleotidase family)
MKLKSLILLIVVFTLYTTNNQLVAQKSRKSTEIIILHTNDMHSSIDNFGKLAYLADSLRKTHKYVFLVSAGDNFTGNPIVDMYPDKGFPMIELMNKLHFDVTAIGNHEFDMGQELLNKRRQQATFPFISGNIDASGAVLKQPESYVILKAGKIKLPFLALIQLGENGLPDSHPSRLEGLKFTNGIEKAKDFLWLKKKYGMLIGLTHLGVEDDEVLAQDYPQFDLIIGGHSHTTMSKPMMVNGVMIVQTGSYLRNVGITTLQVKKGKITDRRYELVPLASISKTDPEVQAMIDKYNSNEEMNRVVAYAETPFSNHEELGCMMTDAITSRMNVDFAFQNGGGIRISKIPQGDITLKDIFRLDPFGNQVVTYTLTYEEIKSLICNSYNRNKSIDLVPSGMSYSVIVNAEGLCSDVEMKDKSGNLLDTNKTYTVGLNSYIAASYKFDHKDPGTTNYNTSAQTLLDYLQDVKKVNYSGVKRVSVLK